MQDVLISHKYPTLTPPSQEYLLQGIDVRVTESSDRFVFPACLQLYAQNTHVVEGMQTRLTTGAYRKPARACLC